MTFQCRSQGVQWPVRENDAFRVELDDQQIGFLSGAAVMHLIQHHLATVALQVFITEELRRDLIDESPVPMVALQRKGPVTGPQRAALRAARKSRRRTG